MCAHTNKTCMHARARTVLPLAFFIKQDHAARAARRAKADAAVRTGSGVAQGRPEAGGAPDVRLALPTLSSLKRDATSLDSAVAAAALGPVPPVSAVGPVPPVPSLCSAQVTIRAVGDCDGSPPLGSFPQNCQAVGGNHQAILQYLKDKGYNDVREFRNAGAQLVDASSFFPEEVWALR